MKDIRRDLAMDKKIVEQLIETAISQLKFSYVT